MSGRAGAAAAAGRTGRGEGGRNRGGRGRGGRGGQQTKKKPKHRSTIKELGDHVFDSGEPEDAGRFVKAKEALINYIRVEGEKEANLVAQSLENMQLGGPEVPPAPPQIPDPAQGAQAGAMINDPVEHTIWEQEIRQLAKRRLNFAEGYRKCYATIWDMCTPGLRKKLQDLQTFDAMQAERNPVDLLQAVSNSVCGREEHKQPVYSLMELHKSLYLFHQTPHQSNQDYADGFEALWDSLEAQGGCTWRQPGLIEDRTAAVATENGRAGQPNNADVAEAEEWVKERYKAALMLSGADHNRHNSLRIYLENRYTVDRADEYPANTRRLLSSLNNLRSERVVIRAPPRNQRGNEGDGRPNFVQVDEGDDDAEDEAEQGIHGGNFLQQRRGDLRATGEASKTYSPTRRGKPRSNTNQGKKTQGQQAQKKAIDKAKVKAAEAKLQDPTKRETCMHCGGEHSLADCPDLTDEQLGQLFIQLQDIEDEDAEVEKPRQDGGMLQQGGGISEMLNPNWVYVDTCTTDDQMVNPAFLTGIHQVKKRLNLQTNAGSASTNKKGYLGSTLFWLDQMGIANVVSLKTLEAKFKITYDSTKDDGAFVVHTPDGKVLVKRCEKTSFPYIDLTDEEGGAAIMMVQTVRQRYEGYTKKEVERAIEARKLQGRLGNPSEATFKGQVSRRPTRNSLFSNCKINAADIQRARKIFGPSVECIKGKATRRKPRRVEYEAVTLPPCIVERFQNTLLLADVMFVCGLPFLVTMSRGLKFVTAQYVPRRTAPELGNSLKSVLQLYKRANINIALVLMDGEFEKIKDHKVAEMVELNTTAKNEHVGEIEREIRVIKERSRATKSGLPYAVLPRAIIKAMVLFEVMWLNAICPGDGWSTTYSPREIVVRWQLDVALHCRGDFGSYCLAYDEPVPTNTQEPRGRDCICLGPTGNRQGTYKFYDLKTKSVIKRKQFDQLPVPDRIIRQVERAGRRDEQDGRLKFANRNNVEFDWSLEDTPLVEDDAVEPPTPLPSIPAEMPGVVLEEDVEAVTDETDPEDEDAGVDQAERARAAAANADFGPRVQEALRRAVRAGDNDGGQGDVIINVHQAPPMAQEPRAEEDEGDLVWGVDPDEEEGLAWDDGEGDDDYVPSDEEQEEESLDLGEGPDSWEDSMDEEEEDDGADGVEDDQRQRHAEERPHQARSRNREVRGPSRMNLLGAQDEKNRSGLEARERAEKTEEKPRSDRAVTPLPGGTTTPRRLAKGALDSWMREHAPGSAKETWRSRRASSIVVEDPRKAYTCRMEASEAPIEVRSDETTVFGMIMQQVSLRQGIKLWGDQAKSSAMKEMKQMHDMSAFIPRHAKTLTSEEKRKALRTLIFLKEKRDKRIKSRTCIDGSPQRDYIPKEDASSPTAARDAIFIQSAIDAMEGRDVAYADMPGAFLHTKTDEHVIVLLTGELCELMVAVDPKIYRRYVTTGRSGRPMLYVQLYKSVYGLLRSALLFYRKFKKELMDYGFEMNPYDPCTANMDTPGGQMTVQWHVDDVKASCRDSFEITKLFKYLDNIYGNKIVAHRGKRGEYLGINFDYSIKGAVVIDMIEYIGKIFEEFPEEITRRSPTPAADHLFKVRDEEDAQFLPEEMAQAFHKTVAQLLFLTGRARPDIATAVSFLTTRVQTPDEDDWGKLRRILQYLKGTRKLKLVLRAKDLSEQHWYVDASHGVHWDFKGQTGACMTMGEGAVINVSLRQKNNTKSTCETELIGVDDCISSALWSVYFVQAQGHEAKNARIYQDNQSAILLEKNGRMSSSRRTRHIKSKYFFVTDKVEDGEVAIEYCPTDQMWSDCNTKPKQGTPFRRDRSKQMGCALVPQDME